MIMSAVPGTALSNQCVANRAKRARLLFASASPTFSSGFQPLPHSNYSNYLHFLVEVFAFFFVVEIRHKLLYGVNHLCLGEIFSCKDALQLDEEVVYFAD